MLANEDSTSSLTIYGDRPYRGVVVGHHRRRFRSFGEHSDWFKFGESAGPTISLSAAVLRSSGLRDSGQWFDGAAPFARKLRDAYHQVLSRIASGELRIQTEYGATCRMLEMRLGNENSRARLVIIPYALALDSV